MKMLLKQLDSSLFNFETWGAGSLLELGLQTRFDSIVSNKDIIQKHAIGWAKGYAVPCRPKTDCRAVMFEKDGYTFWTHLMEEEFNEIFEEEI